MLFTRVKLPEIMEVPVQPCIIATKDVQLPVVANWKGKDMSRGNGVAQGVHKKITDTHRLNGSCAPQAAPEYVDSQARPRFWCQRLEFGCSKSHCWNEMAQSGQHGPQRHTYDCPALWLNGSPSSVQGYPSQEQRDGEEGQHGFTEEKLI